MIYKPEHIADLQSGAIIAAEVRPSDAGDTADLSTRITAAAERVGQIHGEEHPAGSSRVRELCADKPKNIFPLPVIWRCFSTGS